jgi:spore maturation protein A
MLNHIWLALVLIGILTAAGRDIYDAAVNTHGNGIEWEVALQPVPADAKGRTDAALRYMRAPGFVSVDSRDSAAMSFPAVVVLKNSGEGRVTITLGPTASKELLTIAEAQGGKQSLGGVVRARGAGAERRWYVVHDAVNFVYMRKITMAAIDAAGVAVEIAIGLIGIMALWLGMMAVAEKAGIIALIARAVRPVMKRLFPGLPSDHPAVAAIVMNISANMLGLGNAATPFGLKAMEELNKVNPKAGTATNEMCTFLAMNTSCITLIPATAIAVRAASGSADPAIIIGTTFLASLTATIVAVATAKTLQRLRMFRFDRGEEE